MAKKNIKIWGRKALSMLLTLTMVTSMLQIPAFAASSADQIMDGHFIVNENGNQGKAEEGVESVTEDGFTLTKAITPTAYENQFNITLTVETSQTVTTSASKAATVLVIDLSNSMNDSFSGSTRMAEARKVAKQFLASYAGTDENASQYLSVVWFGTNGGVDVDWVNVAGGEGKNSYNDVYNYLNTVTAPHGDKWSGGTNLEGGLMVAKEQMAERASIAEQKNVVLITDGKPTYYLNNKGEVKGDGQNGSETNNSEAAAQATAIKNAGSTLYTVCLAAEDDICYTGASITVCKHCEQTQDKHLKVTNCRNCGETKSEHNSFRWYGNTYYTCPGESFPYGNDDYYSERTHIYCDDSHTTQYDGKTINGAAVTVGYFLSNDIASSAATAFNASTTSALEAALKAIASSIESTGQTGEGTTVTDPMGQYIVLGDVSSLEGDGVTVNGNGISWALDPSKAIESKNGDTTTYTYSITYPITLDTSAEGFQEDVYYATNGHTYLSVPQEDGSVKPISFLVPGVKGIIPEYDWTVEYYLEDESSINLDQKDKTYTLDNTEDMGDAKLHTSVLAPEGHDKAYDKDGYTFAHGDTSIVITKDESKNVIRLYYNLKVAPVTVKHYYKTTTISPEGVETIGEYVIDPDKTSTEFAKTGVAYSANEQSIFGGVEYDFDKAEPGKTIHISETRENLIEMFYSRIDDQREPTTAQVDHVYTLSTYELNEDGKYELVEKAPVKEEKVQYSEDKLAGQVYPVSAEPIKEGYELNPDLGDYEELAEDGMSFVIKPAAEDNIRTLYFEKTEDSRVETKVTVEHYYTKNITAIEDGEVVNYNDPDGELGLTEEIDIYVGEKFVATESNEYLSDTYNSDESNAGKLVVESVEGGEVIKLYYDLSVAPEQAEVIANHYWRTFTEVTVELTEEVVNEETGETETIVIGTDTEIRESVDHKIEGIEYTGLYEGQKHTEAQKSWGEGYTFNAEESIVEVIAGSGDEANLFYDKHAEADERSDADIKVHHNYTTYLTTIVGGEVKTLTVKEGPVEESYTELKAGDEFVAVAQPVYNENEYTQTTDNAELTKILQPGTNATIVINYERSVNALVDTTYEVNYEYRTYSMSINEEGVAGYWNAPEVTNDYVSGTGYVDQKITLDPKAAEGFTALQDNSAVVQILKAEGNSYTFVYEKYIPLAAGSVVVNHHYKTITIAVNGTSSEATQVVPGTPVTKHIGETFTAEAVLDGFEQTGVNVDAAAVELAESVAVTVGEATVIDFFYEKTNDLSIPVTYSVAHEYYLYDWDGSLISESKPAPVTGTGFATNLLVVAPEANDYELRSATYNGSALEDYNIILQDGENVIVFQYEKTLARDFVDAKVIHNYYRDEAAMNAEDAQPEKQYEENFSNLPEGSEFSAEQRIDEGYVFHSANPESMEIVVTEGGENVIILNYVRASASYEVIHIYNRNGAEEGRTSETFGGLDGDVITAESIARVTEYNGINYSFVSMTEDIVLDSDAEVLPSIVLTYNRTVFTPPPGGGGRTPDPKPEPQPEPDPVIEIPEEEVPLAPAPVEEPIVEIPDEEVPLAVVPKTGDDSFRFILMALAAALGLAALAVTKKREEDEMA